MTIDEVFASLSNENLDYLCRTWAYTASSGRASGQHPFVSLNDALREMGEAERARRGLPAIDYQASAEHHVAEMQFLAATAFDPSAITKLSTPDLLALADSVESLSNDLSESGKDAQAEALTQYAAGLRDTAGSREPTN